MKEAYSKKEFLNILYKKGYTTNQVNILISKINYSNLYDLLNEDYIIDICEYLNFNFFNINNLNRYILYKNEKDLDYETTIIHVNIGLDKKISTPELITNPRNYSACVNKYNKLDSNYIPNDLEIITEEDYTLNTVKLRKIVCEKFLNLAHLLKDKNINLRAIGGYKKEKEYQTGLNIDISINNMNKNEIFNSTAYEDFISEIHKYGFILRYPRNKKDITGNKYNPFHIKYVDKCSKEIYDRDITLEEYNATLPIMNINSYLTQEKQEVFDNLFLVNKENVIEKTYTPKNMIRISNIISEKLDKNRIIMLVEEVSNKFLEMKKEASKNDYSLEILSGYRSYEYQEKLFQTLKFDFGEEYALSYCAPPGATEHQTGLAFDIAIIKDGVTIKIDSVPEIKKWIHENAHTYGFILRYPEDKKDITGYNYEPWHLRYVGVEHAKYIYENNLTLEEYLQPKNKKLIRK